MLRHFLLLAASALIATTTLGRSIAVPRVPSTVRTQFKVHGGETTVAELTVQSVPAGSNLRLSCGGPKCPFASRDEAPVAADEINLAKWFDGRALPSGNTIELRVTKPDVVGKVFRWKTQTGRMPEATLLCLPNGASEPVPCP